jgi:hypothetical protein
MPEVLGWAPVFTGPAGAVLSRRRVWRVQASCRAWMRCQAVARSVDQVQPGGIFRIFLRAWVTRRAGAEKIR